MEEPKDNTTTGPGRLSARDAFASDESIHKLLDRREGQDVPARTGESSGSGWSTLVRVMVAANLMLITVMVVYLFITRSQAVVVPAAAPTAQSPAYGAQPVAAPTEPIVPVKEAVASDDTSVAVQFAQELYENGKYEQALAQYRAVSGRFAAGQQDARLMAAYIQFKIALCQLRLNNKIEAASQLNTCISGPSPAVAALASYYSANIEMQAERYTVARTRLYNCIALLGALPQGLQESLERECSFLLAQATVSRYLQIGDSRVDLPAGLWSRPALDDPAAKMDYEELLVFVSAGKDLFPSATLIRQEGESAEKAPSRWTVAAKNTGVFDLLSSLGARASFSMKWDTADLEKTRPVSVRLVNKSPDGAAETIAGCAGLMASVRNGAPTIINPESIMSRDDQKKVYAGESLQMLNRFILLYTKDDSAASAYFAMGIVHELTGAATAAIGDYKLLVSRYSNSTAVPFALWNSSRVKLSLRDSAGAKEDLQQLVELNPDHLMHTQASMKLAELMMAEGMYREANRLFRKAYNMNASGEYQAAAAFAAGQCLYELGEDSDAAEWFSRYIQLEKNPASPRLYEASMSLAKSLRRIGKVPQSVEALKFAMARELTIEQRTRAAIELARTEAAGQSYVKALAAIQNLPITPNLTDDEIEALLLSAQIHCEIGVPEKAAIMLQNAMDRAYSKERAAALSVPLAGALVQMGDARKAAEVLTKTLANIKPSATANEICCELAEINIDLGHHAEAVSLCTGLLASKPSDELMERAFRIMGRAYTGMKQYDKAAMAFAGKVSIDGGGGI